MLKKICFVFLLCILCTTAGAAQQEMQQLAKQYGLYGGEKATVQWVRIFSSSRHLKRYKLDTLDKATLEKLRAYLIEHAADSEQPIVPGL